MHVHLKAIHGIQIQKPEETNAGKEKTQKKMVETAITGKEDTLEAVVSRLIAKDGLSF